MDYTYRVIHKDIDWHLDKPFNIYFFGDVHFGTRACDIDRFNDFINKSKKDPNAHYIAMGDMCDFASTKERKNIEKADLHDQSIEWLDDKAEEQVRKFTQKIAPMKGKMLGIIQGNHTWKFTSGPKKGYFAEEVLAERMETEYMGWLCVYCISFKVREHTTRSFYMVCCHGKAGGKLLGTSINQVTDLRTIFPFADLYVMGHNHDRGAWPATVLMPKMNGGNFKIAQHRQYFVRSGSFLKAYEPDESQYTTRGLLRPADLGTVMISVSFKRSARDKKEEFITEMCSVV